jgi:hypothetical protein
MMPELDEDVADHWSRLARKGIVSSDLFVECIFAREMPSIDDSYDRPIPFCDPIITNPSDRF